jgi:hypothetical protein
MTDDFDDFASKVGTEHVSGLVCSTCKGTLRPLSRDNVLPCNKYKGWYRYAAAPPPGCEMFDGPGPVIQNGMLDGFEIEYKKEGHPMQAGELEALCLFYRLQRKSAKKRARKADYGA